MLPDLVLDFAHSSWILKCSYVCLMILLCTSSWSHLQILCPAAIHCPSVQCSLRPLSQYGHQNASHLFQSLFDGSSLGNRKKEVLPSFTALVWYHPTRCMPSTVEMQKKNIASCARRHLFKLAIAFPWIPTGCDPSWSAFLRNYYI